MVQLDIGLAVSCNTDTFTAAQIKDILIKYSDCFCARDVCCTILDYEFSIGTILDYEFSIGAGAVPISVL